jgi:hypothetical protein
MIDRDGARSWPVTEHPIQDSTEEFTGHSKSSL